MIEELKEAPTDGKPLIFVTIHHGCGGWNSGVWRWCGDDVDGYPGYEPQMTGFTNTSIGTGSREDAVLEARGWAEDEELPLWIPPER